MTDETMGLEEIIDNIEIPEPEEEEVVADEDDAPDEDIQEDDAGVPSGEPEVKEDVFARFNETRNPHDLPEGPYKDQLLNLQRAFTQASMENAELRKAPRDAPPPMEPPTIDFDAEPEEIVKQINDLVNHKVAQAAAPFRVAGKQMVSDIQQREADAYVSDLESHVMSLPGYSDEIGNKMAEAIKPHLNDPQWAGIVRTKPGLEMLFERVKGKMDIAAEQNKAAQRTEQKAKSTPRGKTSKARGTSAHEKFAGMSLEQAVNAAVDAAIAGN